MEWSSVGILAVFACLAFFINLLYYVSWMLLDHWLFAAEDKAAVKANEEAKTGAAEPKNINFDIREGLGTERDRAHNIGFMHSKTAPVV